MNTEQLRRLNRVIAKLPTSRPEPKFKILIRNEPDIEKHYLKLRGKMPNATFPQIKFHLLGGVSAKCKCGKITKYRTSGYAIYCSLGCQQQAKTKNHNTRMRFYEKHIRVGSTTKLSTKNIRDFKAFFKKYSAGTIERKVLDDLYENHSTLFDLYCGLPAKNARARRLIAIGILPITKACKNCGKLLVAERDNYYTYCDAEKCKRAGNKEATQKTLMARYGTTCISKIPKHKEKCQETTSAKYGVKHHTQSAETKRKIRKTCLKRYGVRSHNQNPEIHSKQTQSRYTAKSAILNGNVVKLRGYEPKALEYMIHRVGIPEGSIIADRENIPTITYTFLGKDHRYFPDFYIPKRNLIVEVKSVWTLASSRKVFNTMVAKASACLAQGFKFKLLVMKPNGEELKLPATLLGGSYAEAKRLLRLFNSLAYSTRS